MDNNQEHVDSVDNKEVINSVVNDQSSEESSLEVKEDKCAWLAPYRFPPGNSLGGRKKRKVFEELILKQLSKQADKTGKTYKDLVAERYVLACAGKIHLKMTELEALKAILLRFDGKGEEANDVDNKEVNQQTVVIVDRILPE